MKQDIFEQVAKYGSATTEFERLPLDIQDRLKIMRDAGEVTITTRRDGLMEIKR